MAIRYAESRHLCPRVIDAPGQYRTRAGETVTINHVGGSYWHTDCHGIYSTGQHDSWHQSGRIFHGILSDHDIVEKLA